MAPAASVVVNTYNRAPYLQRLLASLDHQQGAAFEVVVVNGRSTDATGTVLSRYQDRITLATCDTPNLARSRNIGLACATSPLVLFIDDDALPCDTGWVARYVDAFARAGSERLAAVGGTVWHADTNSKEFDGGFSTDYALQVFNAHGTRPQENGRWFPRVPGGNCAFRRDRLIEVGGFDEFFTYYLEETDVCARLVRAGYEIAYQADNGIHHYVAPSDRRRSEYDRNWHDISRSDAYFCLRHGRDRLLPMRLARTVAFAIRKHHLRQLITYVRDRAVPPAHGARMLWGWSTGFLRGAWAGARAGAWAGTRTDTKTAARHGGSSRNAAAPPLPLPVSQPQPPHAEPDARRVFQRPSSRRRLRIAIIAGAEASGTPPDLALGLHARGHEVFVFSPGDRETMHASAGLTIAGVPGMKSPPQRSRVINPGVGYALGVVQQLRALHAGGVTFDIVHAVSWDPGTIGILRSGPYRLVLTLLSNRAMSMPEAPDENLRIALTQDAWHIARARADDLVLTAPSRETLARARELLRMNTDANGLANARLLPLASDVDHVAQPRSPSSLRAAVGRTAPAEPDVQTMAAATEALYFERLAAASAAPTTQVAPRQPPALDPSSAPTASAASTAPVALCQPAAPDLSAASAASAAAAASAVPDGLIARTASAAAAAPAPAAAKGRPHGGADWR